MVAKPVLGPAPVLLELGSWVQCVEQHPFGPRGMAATVAVRAMVRGLGRGAGLNEEIRVVNVADVFPLFLQGHVRWLWDLPPTCFVV